MNDADTALFSKRFIISRIDGTPDANLNGALRVQQTFLDGASKRRAMGIGVVTEVTIVGVGVGIEMHHANWLIARQSPENWQCDQVITSN
ncbi:hypothetical protein D3C80_1860100 [compost metagenome]